MKHFCLPLIIKKSSDKFFKKAKEDEKARQVMRTVLEETPIPFKGIKPRRVPGSSGRLRKLHDGGWEFSDDEADPQEKTNSSPKRETVVTSVNELKLKMEEMKGIEVKLSLRIRQSQSGQLQDISFPFVIGTGKG